MIKTKIIFKRLVGADLEDIFMLNRGDLVYVAGQFTAPEGSDRHSIPQIVQRNVNRAIDAGIKLLELGLCPFIPHLSHYVSLRMNHDLGVRWYEIDMSYLKVSKAICLLDGWGNSKGAVREYAIAQDMRLPVIHEHELKDVKMT